jgi:Na+/H+-dicarboxylate symporter
MGLPLEPLGLLLAVDTIPDVFATVGNVSADLTASSLVARGQASPLSIVQGADRAAAETDAG